MRFNPLRALRPLPQLAARMSAPPYDVVDRAEAARLAAGNPLSFLHVTRPEIDLPEVADPYDDRVYATGRENLDRLVAQRAMVHDPEPAVYIYRLVAGDQTQTGIVGCVHIDDYERDIIRKHEKTRRDKEDDRTRHILTLNADPEPVFLMYRDRPDLASLMEQATHGEPLYDFTADDGVRHTVWRIADTEPYVRAFHEIPYCYIADGHHRCASAWRAGMERRAANRNHEGDEAYNWFLAALFPASQLNILPYNRVVRDFGGQTEGEILHKMQEVGPLTSVSDPNPPRPGSFCFYTGDQWTRVEIDDRLIDRSDPIESLDVALLEKHVLGQILNIGDVRTDKRIDFVGGIRGPEELERRVNEGEAAIAFSLHPTTVEQLIAVSDAGKIMPPKSTWFEPKLRSGLFVHTLE